MRVTATTAVFIVAITLACSGAAWTQTRNMCMIKQPTPGVPENVGTLDAYVSIILRIEFRADGEIGKISPILAKSSPTLTNLATEAAKKIKFVPAEKDGEAVATFKQLLYRYEPGGWIMDRTPKRNYCPNDKFPK
jgi:hypothetical protein